MFEYIQFYTKNFSNFTILLLIGAIIAILDITIRKIVKGVYLNVRDNIRRKHGIVDSLEGMENKKSKTTGDDADNADKEGGGGGGGADDACPKDCNAVEAMRKKLTGLIENAAKLQKDIKENNDTIKHQQKVIENMQKSVQKLVEKSK